MNPPSFEDDEIPPMPELSGLREPRMPERDLWPGIETRLQPRRTPWRRRSWPYALAASLLAALALSLWLRVGGPEVVPAAAPDIARTRLPLTVDSRAIVEAHLQMLRQSDRQIEQALQSGGSSQSLLRIRSANRGREQQLQAMLASDEHAQIKL